jgi:hypothetical protein
LLRLQELLSRWMIKTHDFLPPPIQEPALEELMD